MYKWRLVVLWDTDDGEALAAATGYHQMHHQAYAGCAKVLPMGPNLMFEKTT